MRALVAGLPTRTLGQALNVSEFGHQLRPGERQVLRLLSGIRLPNGPEDRCGHRHRQPWDSF